MPAVCWQTKKSTVMDCIALFATVDTALCLVCYCQSEGTGWSQARVGDDTTSCSHVAHATVHRYLTATALDSRLLEWHAHEA